MTILVKRVSQNKYRAGLPRSACGGEAPTSLLGAHSRSAAGPSDTDLVQSKTER